MTDLYLRHKIIVGPANENGPQTEEAALTAQLLPGQLIKLDPATQQFVATAKGDALHLVLMQNSLFGGDVTEAIAAGGYGVGTLIMGDTDYASFVTCATAIIPNGTPLYMGAGVLTSVVDVDNKPVAVLREDIPASKVTDKILAKIRRLQERDRC